MEKRAQYFDEITILRAFAILAVISIHVSTYFTYLSVSNFRAEVLMAIDVFSQFAVPLFIFISGFVIYNKYPGPITLKKFYENRMMAVIPPYLIFSTFYLGFTYFIKLNKASFNLDIPHIMYQYATGGAYFHLSFFILIIEFYLLYPVIVRIFNFCKMRGRTVDLLFAVFLIGVLYRLYPIPNIFIPGILTSVFRVVIRFIEYLFYFILGMAIRSRYDEFLRGFISKTSYFSLFVPLLCGTIIGTFDFAQTFLKFDITKIIPFSGQYWRGFITMITPLYFVLIFILCFKISLHIVSHKNEIFKFLDKIGHYSFGIYLIHAFILYEVILQFAKLGFTWNNWLFYPVTFCLTLILSVFSVEVLRKLPHSKYIIGSTR
jgi:surface polysaccharide O-acyltransferase-like enzyme